MTKRFAAYLRVSTGKQTVDMQRHEIKEFIARNGLDVEVTEYIDEAWGGRKDDRPAFNRLLEACECGSFDTVICYRLDRVSRSANTAIRSVLRLDELGIGFIATSQAVLNLGKEAPFRRMILAAFAEIAEMEHEIIVSRIKAGLDAARARGVKLGRARGSIKIPATNTEMINSISEMALAGYRIKDIAAVHGIHPSVMQKFLMQNGLQINKPRQPAKRRICEGQTLDDVRQAIFPPKDSGTV